MLQCLGPLNILDKCVERFIEDELSGGASHNSLVPVPVTADSAAGGAAVRTRVMWWPVVMVVVVARLARVL